MGGEPSFAGATRDRKQNGRGHRPEQKGGGEAQCLQSQDEEAGKAEEDRPFQPDRPITKQRGELKAGLPKHASGFRPPGSRWRRCLPRAQFSGRCSGSPYRAVPPTCWCRRLRRGRDRLFSHVLPPVQPCSRRSPTSASSAPILVRSTTSVPSSAVVTTSA